ncbi:MAG: cytochrome C oxidase subunit IV family protein [Betaproteobacteria bacterium]|nr:cytochrome C oxidase subunit IV family protein [Betaproteobacteria bacterium]
MNARRLDLVFAFLVAATGVTWVVGESGSAGPAAVALILGLAFAKGWLVIREFMVLRRASLLWNLIVGGWLTLVLAIIALTYWKAL